MPDICAQYSVLIIEIELLILLETKDFIGHTSVPTVYIPLTEHCREMEDIYNSYADKYNVKLTSTRSTITQIVTHEVFADLLQRLRLGTEPKDTRPKCQCSDHHH